MSKKTATFTLVSIFLLGVFSLVYFNFLKYQPKVLKKVQEVRGLNTITTDGTPYPADAVKIGSNQTPKSVQTTFRTEKTQSEVKEFYKNIFNGKKWKLVTERVSDDTFILAFQREKEIISIVATPQENGEHTIVSIETVTK